MLNWNDYWNEFITKNKLQAKVHELEEFEALYHTGVNIKDLCEQISEHYDNSWRLHLEEVQGKFLKDINSIEGVHLSCNRIKKKDSLLLKIIDKKYKEGLSPQSKYRNLDSSNYFEIVTDLIGMRMIINYRGKWQDIHTAILALFPFNDSDDAIFPLPHILGQSFTAERPKVFYAFGDSIAQYEAKNIETCLHEKGYRGLHYIVSYDDVYIEVQVRTIYDEAWSDCDHRYVYKHEASPSNNALKQLSPILCSFTNIAGDISDLIRDIYESNDLCQGDANCWVASNQTLETLKAALVRLSETTTLLEGFKDRLKNSPETIYKSIDTEL